MKPDPRSKAVHSMRLVTILILSACVVAGCAGPHGERPALDQAVERPGAQPYGFTGGYVGATGGGFR